MKLYDAIVFWTLFLIFNLILASYLTVAFTIKVLIKLIGRKIKW